MNVKLHPLEARVIGCLVEKEITTADQYPLSLNALVNACNQKSNRDPMLNLDERTVQGILDGLARRHLVLERSGFGSRVPKYQHRFCNTEFSTMKFSPLELAILCELLLRGPQTPGELRSRASRMASIGGVDEVELALDSLASRNDGPYVVRLAREPGRRDSCWAQLFCDTPASPAAEPAAAELRAAAAPAAASQSQLGDPREHESRIAELEARIEMLSQRLTTLEAQREA